MANEDFHYFLGKHLSDVEPLMRNANISYWNATISGSKKDFKKYSDLQIKLQQIYSSKEEFKKIKKWKNGNEIKDPKDKRQLALLYNSFMRNQIDPDLNRTITELAASIENKFNVFRGNIDGENVSSNDIMKILKRSTDSERRRKAWEAGKEVGALVAGDLLKLVHMRNDAARALGFSNFYSMSLALNEQDETGLLALFDELDSQTRSPFCKMKQEVDSLLAKKYGITSEEIRPWHYEDPFFQRAPQVYDIDLDSYYKHEDILEIVEKFFDSIGLDVTDIIGCSDLYEKSGKEQHAYCMDVDRNGDIRVLANIKNDENWAGTMLHELGHGVYDKYIDPKLPFLLRDSAHIFTTEAIAMFFGRLSKNADWIQGAVGISDREKSCIASESARSLRLSQLVFARWCQIMMHFERELYTDPDRDLNKLWWELAEKYQLITVPEGRNAPDWASKIHIVTVPVYYHNYMLGELLASQITHYIRRNILDFEDGTCSLYGRNEIGNYLKKAVFEVGAVYKWDKMIELATEEKLTPRYFVEQFVE